MNIVVFWEAGFPFVETCAVTQDELRQAVSDSDTLIFAGMSKIATALQDETAVLLMPYGSAFPKAAWTAIFGFLKRSGSWVNLGGSPLTRPVRRNADGSWHTEVATTAYSKELFINQAFPITLDGTEKTEVDDFLDSGLYGETYSGQEEAFPVQRPVIPEIRCSRVWSLQVRFTDTKDYPLEQGSSGTRDAVLKPLVCLTRAGKSLAAPLIKIDRLRGLFAGGRWILLNAELTEPCDPLALHELLAHAAQGPIELEVRPDYACYYANEAPSLTVRIKAHRLRGHATLELQVTPASGGEVFTDQGLTFDIPVMLSDIPRTYRPDWGVYHSDPGLYTVNARLFYTGETPYESVSDEEDEFNDPGLALLEIQTGYWVYDEKLLSSATPLTVNRDYFERDGVPYPVMGTTYMAGDTHRKFLFEPNPAIWNRDIGAMAAEGVNMIRTGLWTGWRRAMLDPGAMDEGVLRAFTAFLLTARQYNIPVIFNFFAFWPEEWGGRNPYLDPRAISAQQEFVAAFAQRFANVHDLMWDFINEPSVTSPARVWSARPNYDAYEREAWAKWLQAKATEFSTEEKAAENWKDVWRERWRLTPNMPLDLPALEDFHDQNIFQGTHPNRVLDFRLFTQDVFNDWVRAMTAAIRSNGNPHQLITVGQDEGGIWERPNPHFYADVVDVTTNHSWWQNDDLLWDSVMTKTPHKPNLLQETGLMFYEKLDGSYLRSPEACANLLARKLALSFAAGCAGAIQWLWNTNIYMDSDNEVGIGFHRADGTEKPELEAFTKIARFVRENREKMVGRKLEDTVVVIPHSNMFSVRNTADRATRNAIRALEYTFGTPTRTVSEYRIADIGDPKTIVLPSPRVLTQTCWETILQKVEAGATLVLTGPIDSDEYLRPVPRLAALGLPTTTALVSHTETLHTSPTQRSLIKFAGDKIQKLEKTVPAGDTSLSTTVLEHGNGKIHYSPLPLELAEGSGETTPFYSNQTGLDYVLDGLYGNLHRRVEFADYTLHLLLSESGTPRHELAKQFEVPFRLELPPGGTALVFTHRESGEVVAKCELAWQEA